jgi:hypothetical protein
MLGILTIPFYYISVEPFLMTLFVISAVACKSTLGAFLKDFAARSTSFLSSPYGMAVGATLIAIFIISVGQTEKLLRLFVPAHLGICIAVSLLISNIYLKGKNPIRIVTSLCLLGSFQFSISDNLNQYLQRAPVSRVLEGFIANKSNVVLISFQSDLLIEVLLSGAPKNILWPFYPQMHDDKKENYLARKFFNKDYYRFHLAPDRLHALNVMRAGDFLVTSEPIQDPSIGNVESVNLIRDSDMKVNEWQTSFGPTASVVDMLGWNFLDGFVHAGKHIMGSDLSDKNSTLHIYQKCGSFEGYVNRYDDLLAAYTDNIQEKSKHEWGKSHYCTFGIKEGRTYSWLSEASCIACYKY